MAVFVETDRDGRLAMSGDEDEDWFERALREADGDPSGEDAAGTDEGDTSGEDAAGTDEADDETDDGEAVGADREPADDVDPRPSSGDDGSPFDSDFASAFESAPGPDGAGEGGGDPFGGRPGGDESSAEPFDEGAEFDSEIPRIDLGIEGLDNMILGGVPERALIAAVGSAGTGKTTFSLQFLQEALQEGNRAVYLTLEESRERVIDTAEEKGWPFRTYADEGQLAVVHLDPIEMVNSLSSIRSELPELVEEFDADRLVLDSVSLLEMMYDHPSERRSEVYQFTRSLKEAGVTTLVTSEASGENPYNSRYGIIEYLADAVLVLQYVRTSDFQETRLAVEIQKIRDANHSRQMKPYEITDTGLKVYQQANIF